MKDSLITEFATQKVFRFSVIVTIILLLWHFTLLKSQIPYIGHSISWVTTILSPLFALCGINVVYHIYKYFAKKEDTGSSIAEIAPSGYGGSGDVGVFLGLILFIILLPIIAFYLPAEIILGTLYFKKSIYQELMYSWNELTPKEGMFVITKGIFLLMGFSFIVWEILIHILKFIIMLWQWATAEKSSGRKTKLTRIKLGNTGFFIGVFFFDT